MRGEATVEHRGVDSDKTCTALHGRRSTAEFGIVARHRSERFGPDGTPDVTVSANYRSLLPFYFLHRM